MGPGDHGADLECKMLFPMEVMKVENVLPLPDESPIIISALKFQIFHFHDSWKNCIYDFPAFYLWFVVSRIISSPLAMFEF